MLATTTAVQAAFDAGGVAAPLLMVAVGGLLLVFALWWAYFKRDPDIGHHRSLRTMLGWGYGHYFVFAAVAALGAGLGVAADTTHQATDLGAQAAAATVAVPVAVYLAALAVLHAVRGLGLLREVVVAIVLVLVAALAATWIGVPSAVLADGRHRLRPRRRERRDAQPPGDLIAWPRRTSSTSVDVSTGTVTSLVAASRRSYASAIEPDARSARTEATSSGASSGAEPVDQRRETRLHLVWSDRVDPVGRSALRHGGILGLRRIAWQAT